MCYNNIQYSRIKNGEEKSVSNFTGSKCIICENEFNDNDDIVVCPECGTPYHRECYQKEGKCVNVRLHDQGKSWSDSEYADNENSRKKCAHCGTVNKPHAIICENCGASMVDGLDFQQNDQNGSYSGSAPNMNQGFNPYGAGFNPDDKYCGMNPDEEFDDIKLSEAAEFIGTNKFYYLTLFKRMKETGKKISLNAICLLFPQFFFANRKMWTETILTIIVTVLLSIPYMIYSMYVIGTSYDLPYSININTDSFEIIVTIANYMTMAFRVILCLFANWLYYRHMIRKVKTIKNTAGDDSVQKIKVSGGTSFLNIVIAFGVQFLLTAAAFLCFIYLK